MNINSFFLNKLTAPESSSDLSTNKSSATSYLFSDIIKVCEDETSTPLASKNDAFTDLFAEEINPSTDNVVTCSNDELQALSQFINSFIENSLQPVKKNETVNNIQPVSITKKQFLLSPEGLQDFIQGVVKSIQLKNNNLGDETSLNSTDEIVNSIFNSLMNDKSFCLSFKNGIEKIDINVSEVSEENIEPNLSWEKFEAEVKKLNQTIEPSDSNNVSTSQTAQKLSTQPVLNTTPTNNSTETSLPNNVDESIYKTEIIEIVIKRSDENSLVNLVSISTKSNSDALNLDRYNEETYSQTSITAKPTEYSNGTQQPKLELFNPSFRINETSTSELSLLQEQSKLNLLKLNTPDVQSTELFGKNKTDKSIFNLPSQTQASSDVFVNSDESNETEVNTLFKELYGTIETVDAAEESVPSEKIKVVSKSPELINNAGVSPENLTATKITNGNSKTDFTQAVNVETKSPTIEKKDVSQNVYGDKSIIVEESKIDLSKTNMAEAQSAEPTVNNNESNKAKVYNLFKELYGITDTVDSTKDSVFPKGSKENLKTIAITDENQKTASTLTMNSEKNSLFVETKDAAINVYGDKDVTAEESKQFSNIKNELKAAIEGKVNDSSDSIKIKQTAQESQTPTKNESVSSKVIADENTLKQSLDINETKENLSGKTIVVSDIEKAKTSSADDKNSLADKQTIIKPLVKEEHIKTTKEVEQKNSPQDEKIKNEDQKVKESQNQSTDEKDLTKHKSNSDTFKNVLQSAEQTQNIESKITIESKVDSSNVRVIKPTEIIPEFSKVIQQGEKQSITFQLSPENLGKVKLMVEIVDNQINARIEVESEQVKQFIQTNIDQLKQSLNSSGIQLSNINIGLSDSEQRSFKSSGGKKKTSEKETKIKTDESEIRKSGKSLGYNTYEFLA